MTIMRFCAKKNWVKNCAHGEKKWQIWGIGQTLQIVEAEVRYWFELGVQQFEAQMWVWGTVKSKDSVKNIAVPTNGKGQVWYLFELEVWKCVKRYSKEEWGGREPNHCICMASSEWGTNLSTLGRRVQNFEAQMWVWGTTKSSKTIICRSGTNWVLKDSLTAIKRCSARDGISPKFSHFFIDP